MSSRTSNTSITRNHRLGNSQTPGIVAYGEGFMLSSHNLAASDHYFCATHFSARIDESSLHILFTQRSAWDPSNSARLALEIVFPMYWATRFLFDAIWNHPGINGVGRFMDNIAKEATALKPSATKDSSPTLPSDPNCFRMMAANFATSTISSGQGMIEFFEASPDLLVSLTYGRPQRPNEGVKPIVSVICSIGLLRDLFEEIRPGLEKRFVPKEHV